MQFTLVGDGSEKQNVMQRAKRAGLGNVRFLDPLPGKEIPALVASADVVLVALRTEISGAVPSKLYEAMASGRPVVLIAGGEPAQLVRQYHAGLVVPPGAIENLAEAIGTLLSQHELRNELGENGGRAAEQNFDRAEIASRFIDLLEKHL